MEIITGALPCVIKKLGELLIGEYNLQNRVKGEIRFLHAELESMKGALEKVSNTPPDQLDIQDKIWARDLRELSYDIEDSIDTFMVRGKSGELVKLHSIKKFIDRSVGLFKRAKIRHEIATEIKHIKSRVLEVHERRRRYDINLLVDKTTTSTMVDPRLFAQYTEAKELVGTDETRDELVKVLMGANGVPLQQGKIISIVGFGGLGKTTLAKAVYEKIKVLFDCCAFVSVSQTPNLKKLFTGLLYDLGQRINEETLDERRLINIVWEFLKTKRYLIIIDDIWDISVWKWIKCALPNNDVGYTLITTTRNTDVAEKIGGAYNLKPLCENNSRKLLYKRVFGNENIDNVEDVEKCPNEELTEVSERILKKCAGVPLAIITMASLLASKARNKMDWYGVYHSIGTGLEHNLDVENMRKILSFSYYNMPSHLRTCLLYLSMFPEDYQIEKDRLIWMWIAEGFIQCKKQGRSQFELGESYLNELQNRSMIQPIYAFDHSLIGCRVHDMVLDLLCNLSSEANFITIFNGVDQPMSSSSKIRRLSIQNDKEDDSTTIVTMNLQQVRSVIVLHPATYQIPVLRSFQVLRVMDLKDCVLSHSNSLNKCLKNLFHLRYLALCNTNIEELQEIGNLQFLQILDTRNNEISWLPSNVVQLKHLMCLNISSITRVPKGIGSLASLEKLSVLIVDDSNVDIIEELAQLTELRVLNIFLRKWNDKLVDCLNQLQKMQHLSIWGQDAHQMDKGGLDAWVAPQCIRHLDTKKCCWFSMLPAWMNPSLVPGLYKLDIAVREVQQADLDILGAFPALHFLSLFVEHFDLGILGGFVIGAGSFGCLTNCEFYGVYGPVVFQFQHGAMPSVRKLDFPLNVCRARQLASSSGGVLDLGLGNLASLKKVSVYLDYDYTTTDEEVKEVKAALSHAAKIHPNHPELSTI